MTVVDAHEKPLVLLGHRRVTLRVRPGTSRANREELMREWQEALLHETVRPLIAKWEVKLRVNVRGCHLQRMKTKWGGCNQRAGNVRLSTALVKRFTRLLGECYPSWRKAGAELIALPLGAEKSREVKA